MEAASCEIPIVAFDVPGCREIVIDGINGILVPFKDESLFCKAVEKIITNPRLGKKYGKAGRKYVLKNFLKNK